MNRLAASPTPRLEPLKWSPRYETGVPALDAQHQRLFEIVEEVGARARGADGRQGDAFEAIFDRLADYAQFHFDFEEELQAEAGLPEAERRAHAETHRAFIRSSRSIHVCASAWPAPGTGFGTGSTAIIDGASVTAASIT